ncbi:MAG: hypothetical protein JSR78_15135 [Proteobacteria bacterium]|nr:hypothetical protein [Pseudomonadota bacterium]
MANTQWVAASAFVEWRDIPGSSVSVTRRDDLTMANLGVFEGQSDKVLEVIRSAYGIDLPRTPKIVTARGTSFLWYGPNQWLAVAAREQNRDLELELEPLFSGVASIVDQTDARAVVEISGHRARDVLAKGVPIDLHPSAFKTGDVAITHASHIGIVICQMDDNPTYQISMFRSFADSFAEWLFHSCEEFSN